MEVAFLKKYYNTRFIYNKKICSVISSSSHYFFSTSGSSRRTNQHCPSTHTIAERPKETESKRPGTIDGSSLRRALWTSQHCGTVGGKRC